MPAEVIRQSNGVQGRTTFGPRTTAVDTPSKHGDNMSLRFIELQLDGDVKTVHEADFEDETLYAMPDGCLVTDVYVYSEGGVTALDVTAVDDAGATAPLVAGLAVGAGSFVVTRDIDVVTAANVTQLQYSIPAGEKANVRVHFVQCVQGSGNDGVLNKPR